MDCNGRTFEEFPPTTKKTALKDRAAICGNGRIFGELPPPPIKIATYEWAAVDCNEKNFEGLLLTTFEM